MGVILAVFAMICWGLAPLFGKLGLNGIHSMTALSIRTLFAASLIVGWNVITHAGGERIQFVTLKGLLFIALEALLATLIGDLAYFMALKQGNINQVTLIMSSSPLITMAAAYIFLNERVSMTQAVGALLIIGGLVLVGLEPKI